MQPPAELSDVSAAIPTAVLDIRYASTNNFTGTQLYAYGVAWLRPEALGCLVAASGDFAKRKLRIVLFDAFRPLTVQPKLREYCDDTDYVFEVSNHCLGITVDVTLAGSDGLYLDMGTDYDDFSIQSHPSWNGLSEQQESNRTLLHEVMSEHGFTQHPYEWWHFDYQPEADWPLIKDARNAL